MIAAVTKIQQIAQDNSHALLTGVGVAGTISTAVLSGRASFKAARRLDNYEHMDRSTKLRLTWKLYIPPAGVGLITVSAIVLANRVAGKEAAALAAAYTVSEKALTEYREQVVKKFGAVKEAEVHDAFAEERMKKNPVNNREVIIAGDGDVLCFDIMSGRYFKSSRNEIERAEIAVNHEILGFTRGASLSEFYDHVGLPATGYSDTVGWNHDHLCRVRFSSEISTDDKPCLAIDFVEAPFPLYYKLWSD
jgi:hypothetical protein